MLSDMLSAFGGASVLPGRQSDQVGYQDDACTHLSRNPAVSMNTHHPGHLMHAWTEDLLHLPQSVALSSRQQ